MMDAGSSSAAPPSTASLLQDQQQHTSPIPLSKRASSRNALNAGYKSPSEPSTPPPVSRRRKTKTHGKGKEPALPPGARREQLRRQSSANAIDAHRHSHGLSWSSTTRDSVVDNLLLSLDNLSSQHDAFGRDLPDVDFDRDTYRLSSMPKFPQFHTERPASRPRTHTYSSSLSSGADVYGVATAASPSSKYSSPAKGRRSNSSSNFGIPTALDGKARPMRRGDSASKVSTDTLRLVGQSKHVAHASSDLDSNDYGYSSVLETNRLHKCGRRSMSMGQMYDNAAASSGPPVLERGRPVPPIGSNFESNFVDDAAPEPGVPAGPRNKLNPSASGPVYVDPAPSKQTIRKINTQSDLRGANRPSPGVPQHIHDQANDFVRLSSMRGPSAVSSAHDLNAPAPSPGFRSMRNAPSPHRERPGFFKRVFGSGSRVSSGLSDRSDVADSASYLDGAATPARAISTASNDTATQPQQSARDPAYPPSLNKKPSSFFRRRKKSGSTLAPPPLPTNAINNGNLTVKSAEPSPSVSSLRKVMDQYLAKDDASGMIVPTVNVDGASQPATHESTTEDSDDLDMFHSGYTPPPDASLGLRDPLSRATQNRGRGSQDALDNSNVKMKVKKRRNDEPVITSERPPQYLRGSSFLHDDSRQNSTGTIGNRFIDDAKISPLSDVTPSKSNDKENTRPVSRASTGDRIILSEGNSPIVPSAQSQEFRGGTMPVSDAQDEGFVVRQRPHGTSPESKRLVLRPTEAEDTQTELASPIGVDDTRDESTSLAPSSAVQSPVDSSVYHSAHSLPLPSVQIEGKEMLRRSTETAMNPIPTAMIDDSAEYKERARKIFTGDEEDVTKAEAASWLGERNTLSTHTLSAYMQLFDFTGMNILSSLRMLAGKLLLKGETQQFDRIINALSERWCQCNPNHGFKAQDVVHTICYSLILLNTDLHMADIGEKMSRSAYVKNTLPTIRRVATDAAPQAFDDTVRPNAVGSRPSIPWVDTGLFGHASKSPKQSQLDAPTERSSFDGTGPNGRRLSARPSVFRAESDGPDSANGSASNALVNSSWSEPMRGWELEIETVLKSFYNSIRTEPLPLFGGPIVEGLAPERNLSVANLANLRRSGSVVSRTPSDNMSYRSKPGLRSMTAAWQSRNNRSRPKLYPVSTMGSSRTSLDDRDNLWSPTQSSSRSKHSFAKTLTSASMNSLGGYLSPSGTDFKHSIGFANALSQAIIREENTNPGPGDTESISNAVGLLEDEAMALEGAPWAKEGLVKHKHHLETSDRKAKERNWNDCFAVISNGKLTLFAFGTSTKSQSIGRKALHKQQQTTGRGSSVAAKRVGGGDWMENAEQLQVIVLRQTIASVLPPPGYTKARPNVWALSLPSGAVHLFQVGTPEIASEFMTSANYWSARLSKEPLFGGVSNIEYGWSDQVVNGVLPEKSDSIAVSSPPSSMQNVQARHMHSSSGSSNMQRPSYQSSVRGSFDTGGFGSSRARLLGDKVQIADWHPPTQSMMASQLLEVDQLKQLTAYVTNVESELGKHNELKHAIELAYSPRHQNFNRAMTNWQRKSDYLLREIVKFRTYMDSLAAAQTAKEEFYARQESLKVGGGVSPVDSGRMKEERDLTLRPAHTAA